MRRRGMDPFMISRALEAEILRLYRTEGWPIGTIARQLRVHHVTVRRVLWQSGVPAVREAARTSKIDAYIPFILDTFARYPTLRASRLYQMARERGYVGCPHHFRHMVARHRPRPTVEAYLRLRTLPGEQAQVDWGLCRSRHRPHYAEFRTTPSSVIACLFRMILIENYSA